MLSKKTNRVSLLMGTSIVIFLCILFLGLMQLEDIVYYKCLENYGKKIGVQPDEVVIVTKLNSIINSRLSQDMTAAEVHNAFNEVVMTNFSNQGTTLEGGYQEIAMLNICQFVTLDDILINFSNEGFFIKTRLYFGD